MSRACDIEIGTRFASPGPMTLERALASLESLMWSWHEGKLFLERSLSFSQDALHAVAGVLILLAVAVIMRKPVSNRWPWLVVCVITLINEFVDIRVETWPEPMMQYAEGAKDLLLTMFLPTVLLLSARLRPQLYQPIPSGR